MTAFALIHSPFLGPGSWRDTELALRDAGHQAAALDYGGPEEPDYYGSAARGVAMSLRLNDSPVILVAHSAAGGLIPSIAQAVRPGRLAGVVFVDAILPHPGKSWRDGAPESLARRLPTAQRARRLPRWYEWYDIDPTAFLRLSDDEKARFKSEMPRVPTAYIDARAPNPKGWEALPAGYLQLSSAYEDEAHEAERRGWAVLRLDLEHLAIMTEPTHVANGLIAIAQTLRR